jgi:hypothetical protein
MGTSFNSPTEYLFRKYGAARGLEYFYSKSLGTGHGRPLACLLRRRQRNKGHPDDNEHSHGSQQTYSFVRNMDRQHCHNRAVSETRPGSEGDHAAIRRWITYCHQQKNAQRAMRLSIMSSP